MRILLAANASYVPPRGGATRSNLVWLDDLAARGHECRIVCATITAGRGEQMRQEGIGAAEVMEPGIEATRRGLIRVLSVVDPARRAQVLRREIAEFQPDWVLISSEDLSHSLLAEAHHHAHGRVIYLAHTPQFFPIGPQSWNPDAAAAAEMRQAAGVVAIGRHMAAYVERHLERPVTVIHPPIYGRGPFTELARFGLGRVTMINPCAVKGIAIFLETAARLPSRGFAWVPGWGTTAADRAALERLPNVEQLPNARDIEDILRQTAVLLMPSLWMEGFGLIVMEAMLRGIPVVASDAGGLLEAKAGTGYIIPVQPIETYLAEYDEHSMPRPVIPANDVAPWVRAVEDLLGDRAAYEGESQRARMAALQFVDALDAGALEAWLAGLGRPSARSTPLRILLAQNSRYYPAVGGGDKSNRLLLEALAARGHECRVVARISTFGDDEHQRYLGELAQRAIVPDVVEGSVVRFRRHGVLADVVTRGHLRAHFAAQAAAFDPDIILASTDDPAQLLLEAALGAPRARVVYLARATLALPFGPDCAFPSESKTQTLRAAAAVVGVSRYVADYIRRWTAIDALHVPISLMEPEEWPELGRLDNEFVTMVNPCAVKGIAILLALADAMPQVRFAAVPTWGTTEHDRAALAARPNIQLLPPVDDINELLRRTRVLLVPSLWAEARSRVVLEAMLRGVPVMASHVGGIPEAKMGVPYLLPVNPIVKYDPRLDDQMVPMADVPAQDAGPWVEALRRLLTRPEHYREIAAASRRAALDYAANLNASPFEAVLREVLARHDSRPVPAAVAPPPAAVAASGTLAALSPEKRRLLALRLRQRATPDAWFPGAAAVVGPRLFAFPHAGGGAAAFAGWSAHVPVCPVRLPGRESRALEAPFDGMEPLVAALGAALRPYLDQPFAFFGHSMGAAVAFELARWLRRHSLPQPRALFVSAARAPRFRLGHVPPRDPDDREFLDQLRRAEGLPPEVFDDPDVIRWLLPVLRADAALYRRYVYHPEPPLAVPIRAFGGESDANVRGEHLQAWASETVRGFACRLFPGGHFYWRIHRDALLEELRPEVWAGGSPTQP